MKEIVKTHRFDIEKNNIKKFSEEIDSNKTLSTVPTSSGLFDLFSHNVKGAELNKRLEEIQEYFNECVKTDIKIIKEFGTIYNAFEALDKDYIAGILNAIKSAEKASNEAKEASCGAAQIANDAKKMSDKLEKIVNKLKSHKEELEKFKHLREIDDMCNSVNRMKKIIIALCIGTAFSIITTIVCLVLSIVGVI